MLRYRCSDVLDLFKREGVDVQARGTKWRLQRGPAEDKLIRVLELEELMAQQVVISLAKLFKVDPQLLFELHKQRMDQ